MRAMSESAPGPPRNPWLPALFLSIVALCASLALLTFVLLDAISDGETPQGPDAPGSTPAATPTPRPLTFAGEIPPGADALGFQPVEPGLTPDLEFGRGGGPGSIATRYFVPVASIGAGVDALTGEQLRALVNGSTRSWSAVGGLDRAVRIVLVDPGVLRGSAEALAGRGPAGDSFAVFGRIESYDALRAAMTVDSGILTVVPLEELSPGMVALAIDGADLARGSGDPADWPFADRWTIEARTPEGAAALEIVKDRLAASLPAVTTVAVTGDILMSRCSLAAIRATGDWGAALRSPVGEYLAAADLTLGSLDGSIQDIAEPYGCIAMEYPNLTSPPQVIDALTLAGFDGLTVATNHIFDCAAGGCGSQAMLRTIELLTAAGIKTVGGGADLEAALAPAIFEVNGIRFGVLGFDDIAAEDLQATATSPGTAPLDDSYDDERATPPAEPAFYKPAEMLNLARFEERIRRLKTGVDVVIVQVQSGYEDTHDASPRSIKALRAAADAGATLVVGNQAHWVQGAEPLGDAFISYALGNFIFDQNRTPEHTQGYMLEATFHGKKLATVRLLPYAIRQQYRPEFAAGAERIKILDDVVEAFTGPPR